MSTRSHYEQGRISPLQYILENNWDFARGNALKYLHRFADKGTPLEDLDKAIHYIQILKEDVVNNPSRYGLTEEQVQEDD